MIPNLLLHCSLFAMLWWVLAEGNLDGWWLGVMAVVLATWVSMWLTPDRPHRIRLIRAPGFFWYFLKNSIYGGILVAMVALRGRKAMQPNVLEFHLTLPAGAPRVLLINTIGLMPGSLCVEQTGDRLRVHVLDERLPFEEDIADLQLRIHALFGVEK